MTFIKSLYFFLRGSWSKIRSPHWGLCPESGALK